VRWLAAALDQIGQTVEAKEALEKAISVAPASFEIFVGRRVPWHRPEDYAHMLEGLRKGRGPSITAPPAVSTAGCSRL
jgi:hypothetical protein